MIKIWHAPQSRSLRAIWLMEEIGQPYEIQSVDMEAGEHKTDEFKAVHPLGKIPTIEDGDLRLIESGAILDYLAGKYGAGDLEPARDDPAYGPYRQWFHFAEATLARPFADLAQHALHLPEEKRIPAMVPDAIGRAEVQIAYVEQELADGPWILGDRFTMADIMLAYVLLIARLVGTVAEEKTPSCWAYLARIEERPAFQRASQI